MTRWMMQLIGGTAAAVLLVPVLLIMGTPTVVPAVAMGGSDLQQVASLPEARRASVVAAARRFALPPALIAAVGPHDPVRTAQDLLARGRLPGGAWDAAQAVDGDRSILSRAAGHGFRYYPTHPPMDPQRYVFPVVGSASYGAEHHDYPATDLFSPIGTPLVACVRSEVLRVSRTDRGLGGLSVTLRGEDGWRYYYAHLSSVAPGLLPGHVVEPGQYLGRSGNTGNARFTPPHTHLGISKTGNVAGEITPYPYLRLWEQRA